MHELLLDDLGIAADCYSLAVLYDSRESLDEALQMARRALAHDKDGENPPGIAQDLMLLGLLEKKNGRPEQSVDYFQRAFLAWQALGRKDKCQETQLELGTVTLSDH